MADYLKQIDKAEKLLQKGKNNEALAEFKAILQQHPDDDALLNRVADIMASTGDMARALSLFGERFDRHVAAKRIPEALALFRRMQSLQQQQPPAKLLVFANLLEGSKHNEEAEKAYRQAANGFQKANAPEQEMEAWRHVFRLNPKDSTNCFEIAARAEATGDLELAGEAAAQAAALSGEDLPLLEKAYRHLHQRADVALRYARALLRTGKSAEAKTIVKALGSEVLNQSEAAGVYADAMIANGEAEAVRDMIAGRLDSSNEWFDRGLRCLLGLAQVASTSAADFAKQLTAKATTDERKVEWSKVLDQCINLANEEKLLSYLAEAFQHTGKESLLTRTLVRSFDLAFAAGDIKRAVGFLERTIAIDPYTPAAAERVQALKDRIEPAKWQKLSKAVGTSQEEEPVEEALPEKPVAENVISVKPTEEDSGASFDDLMLQAEIFLQYRLNDKAKAIAQTLARLFPGEEASNPRLAHLYENTNVRPAKVQAVAAAASAAAAPAPAMPAPAQTATVAATAAAQSTPATAPATVPSLTRGMMAAVPAEGPAMSQITQTARSVHREASLRRIFFSAVNHFGRLWRADRCLAAKFNSGQAPSHVVEYCAPGFSSSDPTGVARLLSVVEAQFNSSPARVLSLPRGNEATSVRQTLEKLAIDSLVAHALQEAGNVIGVVILESCTPGRIWSSYDADVLENLCDQVVLALGNARLRGLLREFASVDDQTGLLQVSSMLELLVAECAQAQEQRSTLSLMCIELPRKTPTDLEKPEIHQWLQSVAQKMTAYLRPNDTATRLRAATFAIVLPDTIAANCGAIFQRLREVFTEFAWPDAHPFEMKAGVAEIAADPTLPGGMRIQPEDVATEILDRAERALRLEGGKTGAPLKIVLPENLKAVPAGSTS